MRHLALLLTAAAATILPGCGGANGKTTDGIVRSPVTVTAVTVEEQTEPVTVRRSATLLSRVDVLLATESAGVVVSRPIPAGTLVAKNAVVLKLPDAVQRSTLTSARARLAGLAQEGVSLADRQAAVADVQRAEELLRMRTVVAPADGVLDRYDIEEGDYAVPGTPVGRLVSPSKLWLVATVLEDEILSVPTEATVSIEVPAWPDTRFPGKVVRRGSAALPGTGQFEVEIDIDPDPRLLPGFIATVAIPVKGSRAARLVPRDAVFRRHGTWRLFAVAKDGDTLRAAERTVRVRSVPGRPDLMDITSGVDLGTRVVVRGRLGLVDRDLLRIDDR